MSDADFPVITLHKQGLTRYRKMSCPVRYGLHHEIRTERWLVHCNLRGTARYVSGLSTEWPHPGEWLKKTEAGDWVYYSSGSYYSGVFDLYGEHYLPCVQYPTNTLLKENPFRQAIVCEAIEAADRLAGEFKKKLLETEGLDHEHEGRQRQVKSPAGRSLQSILGARIPVLPPDCRHVDYDVIPLLLADGCLYNCSFCRVKTGVDLSPRDRSEIERQLLALRDYFGPDLRNYNSLFLGQHDALAAEGEDLLHAAERAYSVFRFDKSLLESPRLFFFGSADSLLGKKENFYAGLNGLPYNSSINIGLESFDADTLAWLGKPVQPERVLEAFRYVNVLNQRYPQLEISVNFVLGEDLPKGHRESLHRNLSGKAKGLCGRTTVYLSPLIGGQANGRTIEAFRDIKRRSVLDTCLYLIQRL